MPLPHCALACCVCEPTTRFLKSIPRPEPRELATGQGAGQHQMACHAPRSGAMRGKWRDDPTPDIRRSIV